MVLGQLREQHGDHHQRDQDHGKGSRPDPRVVADLRARATALSFQILTMAPWNRRRSSPERSPCGVRSCSAAGPTPQGQVDELIVNGAFAMDSAEAGSERALGRLAQGARRVLLGGSGTRLHRGEVSTRGGRAGHRRARAVPHRVGASRCHRGLAMGRRGRSAGAPDCGDVRPQPWRAPARTHGALGCRTARRGQRSRFLDPSAECGAVRGAPAGRHVPATDAGRVARRLVPGRIAQAGSRRCCR